jgi:hypothetical protein
VVGATLVIVIEGSANTAKLTALLVPALVVTVTLAAPGAALAAMLNLAVAWVALSTFTPFTATPEVPTATVRSSAKLAPVMVTRTLVPWSPLAGLTETSVGPDGLTVNTAALLVPPLVVTVTFAAPIAALASIVSVAVI